MLRITSYNVCYTKLSSATKGKAHMGASSKHPKANTTRAPVGRRETSGNRRRNAEGAKRERHRTTRTSPHLRAENVGGRRVYVETEPGSSEGEERSDNSFNTVRRGRNRGNNRDYDPLKQQLNHLKLQFPSFHGNNDPEVYLDWERKMESNFLVQGTYA